MCITGGAGFIGSTLAIRLLGDGHDVVVLDDLSTGFSEHVPSEATFIHGSIVDLSAVNEAVAGCDVVFHQAAARSVPRSVDDPLGTHEVNANGTLNVFEASRQHGVRRVVFASSSSVYGGAKQLPTPESAPTVPRSPYALTKLMAEHYARLYWDLYGLETVGLRYFNVYGPRQRPDSAYAAVIPIFIDALTTGSSFEVHGDGLQSRSFTFIDDVVDANLAAAFTPADVCSGKVYNAASESQTTLLDLLGHLGRIVGVTPHPTHTPPRRGDIRESWADASAARRDLGFTARISLADGLVPTVAALRKDT